MKELALCQLISFKKKKKELKVELSPISVQNRSLILLIVYHVHMESLMSTIVIVF